MTDTLLEHLKRIAPLGGKAAAKKLTAKQRHARATNAVKARELKRAQALKRYIKE